MYKKGQLLIQTYLALSKSVPRIIMNNLIHCTKTYKLKIIKKKNLYFCNLKNGDLYNF